MNIKDMRRHRLQEWFADKTLPPKDKSYISQIITGKSGLGEKGAQRLEEEYGMPKGYLVNPVDSKNNKSNVTYAGPAKATKEFPLISWVSAGSWLEAIEPYRRDDIDQWPETTIDASEDSFWLRVKGDSMTAPSGFTVPEGMIILIDPAKEAMSGNLVVAKLENDNEATFKQYMVDAGRQYLRALNPHHPPTIINGNCKIIGVVVDIKWEHIP